MTGRDLDDEAISVLVDIARTAGRDLNAAQTSQLDDLIAAGLVVPSGGGDAPAVARYALTAEAQRLLDRRGVGANEA